VRGLIDRLVSLCREGERKRRDGAGATKQNVVAAWVMRVPRVVIETISEITHRSGGLDVNLSQFHRAERSERRCVINSCCLDRYAAGLDRDVRPVLATDRPECVLLLQSSHLNQGTRMHRRVTYPLRWPMLRWHATRSSTQPTFSCSSTRTSAAAAGEMPRESARS
jgi:hypothetical protein